MTALRGISQCSAWVFMLLCTASWGACNTDASVVCIEDRSVIDVSDVKIIRSGGGIDLFWGLHSLWWGTQDALVDQKAESELVKLLKDSNVPFIRYGGASNEIRWQDCTGEVGSRVKKKYVPWSAPLSCRFGFAEYERLNDSLSLEYSWYIANVVGFDSNIDEIGVLKDSAKLFAAYVATLAPRRHRYWELGNEVDRGKYVWSEDEIAKRYLAISGSIKAGDPQAVTVAPLIEFSPSNANNADNHNRAIIRKVKGQISDYSVHVYYDNPPQGPSVQNRLNLIASVARILKEEKVPSPVIWVTEHARWPQGSPSVEGWEKNWYQTNNFDAVLSTADFLTGLSQIDFVGGAMWHGLRAGPWNFVLLDAGKPTPSMIANLFQFLSAESDLTALRTATRSRKADTHIGRYALRAAAFQVRNPKHPGILIWIVNRSEKRESFSIRLPKLRQGSYGVDSIRSIKEDAGEIRIVENEVKADVYANEIRLDASSRSINLVMVKEQ